MTNIFPSLVSTEWLAEHIGASDLVVFDASMHLPAANRDVFREFQNGSIPGARLLWLSDLHMQAKSALTDGDAFPTLRDAAPTDRIVVYDDSAIRSSARAWLLLKAMGYPNVAILDGGLGKWRSEGRTLSVPGFGGSLVGRGQTDRARKRNGPREFNPEMDRLKAGTAGSQQFDTSRFRGKADMLSNLESGAEQVLDARSADRVFATGTDPVHGGQNGRIPGALNLPFGDVFNPDGRFRSADDLRAAFAASGINLDQPVVTTCGSGVTASVLLFALDLIGKHDVALYDGSWSEWSADPDTPKAQGPQ